jgi:hypothetical protein
MTETEIAYRADVLRDTIESGRMPSELALSSDAARLHTRAAEHLESLLRKADSAERESV